MSSFLILDNEPDTYSGGLSRAWLQDETVNFDNIPAEYILPRRYSLREIISNLKHLSERGELIPNIMPKLIDQTEAAELLGISLANFKKLEREGAFSFNRRMVGSSVRYRNLDVIKYLMLDAWLFGDAGFW